MTPDQFIAIRKRHGSQRAVAEKLGIGFRTIQRAERSETISKRNELLILSLEASDAN